MDLEGDRRLILHHKAINKITLQKDDAKRVLQHLADLWGYDVVLKEIEPGHRHGARRDQRQRAADLLLTRGPAAIACMPLGGTATVA